MSFNGSGTFLINTAGQPVVSGTVISSTAFNALTADLATGLSTAITKDGQTTVTANIPMSTYKFTGLGVGSAATDSANLSQVQSTVTKLLNSVSGADTITATASPTLAAYAAGQMFYFVAAGDNTTSVTLNIDSLGAKAVTRDGSVALAAADIKSGEVIVVVYDGTRFQVVSQLNSAGNATFANVSITSALNVGGVATFSAGTAAAPSITTTGDTNTGIFFPAADTIAFTEGGTESFRVNSSGNMGIGTSSPNERLQVTGNARILNSGADTQIQAFGPNGFASFVRWGEIGSGDRGVLGFAAASNTLQYRYGATSMSTGTLGFAMDSSGNLGIGTASPSRRLHVVAADGITNSLFAGATFALRTQSIVGVGTVLDAVAANESTYQPLVAGGSIFAFQTGGTERMRLDSSGNLGLGVTPSAWSGVGGVLEIKGNAYIYSATGVLSSGANAFFNGTNWIYKTTQAATRYEQVNGLHQWSNAASGTAGNAISFTQALTLNSNGNLALQGGTTTASGVGITFPASQSASTDANCLDDYEEGAFTPSFIGTTTNPTVTYGEQAGIYTKVGNLVTFRIRLTATGATGGSGDLRVAGLPFAARGVNNAGIVVVQFALGWGTFPLGPNSIAGSSEIILQTTNISNANITVADLTGGSFDKFYVIAGSYFV